MPNSHQIVRKRPELPVTGGCLCGSLRYSLGAMPKAVYRCHCKDCQRLSGTNHSVSMLIAAGDLTLTDGQSAGFDKVADSRRVVRLHSCPQCGTRVFNEPLATPEYLVLRPGTLDDMSWAEPVGNIWTDSRVAWAVIADDEPSFPRQPPSRQPLIDAWDAAIEVGDRS